VITCVTHYEEDIEYFNLKTGQFLCHKCWMKDTEITKDPVNSQDILYHAKLLKDGL